MNLESRLRKLEQRHEPGDQEAAFIEWLQSLSFDDMCCIASCVPSIDVPLPVHLDVAAAQERGKALIAGAPYFIRRDLTPSAARPDAGSPPEDGTRG
ncbi:MAG: hypothetical protein AB7I38_02625 [Dehalococcoidia bacterium]